MPFRHSIAAKIFGLAVFLLLLTVALATFLLWETSRTEQDLKVVANLDVPLAESFSRVDEFGLRRRLPELRGQSPGANWNGVWQLEEK